MDSDGPLAPNILATLFLMCALGCTAILGQIDTDFTCSWTIWDSTKDQGVHTFHAQCSEGYVSWKQPYGALRIMFSLHQPYKGPFRTCFLTKTYFVTAKVSVEEGNIMRTLHINENINSSGSREICLDSMGETLTVYVEAETKPESFAIGSIVIEYDIERSYHMLAHNDLYECRPCSRRELLTAVCTSDYVATGSIHTIHNDLDLLETSVMLNVDKIYRQKHKVFKRKVLKFNSYSQPESIETESKPLYRGAIVTPLRCNVQYDEGMFLFTGKIRLGRARLGCAPNLEEFQELWENAVKNSQNFCQLD